MKIDITLTGKKDEDGFQPEYAGYPPVDDPLGAPAALEIQFFNLATVPDGDGWKDNPALETEVTAVNKTVELTKGAYGSRKQTDNTIYRKNAYLLSEQTIIDEFGPDNPDRFNREPLLPILIDDPDTNPPNNLDVDTYLRRDGIGVNTPIFHIELLKDTPPKSSLNYKEDKIIRGINVDLKRGIKVYPNQYDYAKKYNDAKQYKTKEPLTFLIDNIWEPKANLSIEEIESASHFITSVISADENTDPLGMGYAIDSVEGIFYNKFDTYLAKDRIYNQDGDLTTFDARYKVTTEPSYSAAAYERAILQFTSGGILKIKVYMMPRNWLYYSRFYTSPVCNENGGGLEDLIYTWYNWSNYPNTPKEWTPNYLHYPALLRNEITNTTQLFALWGKPPHDYRLPRRDDESIEDVYLHMDSSYLGGFCQFDYLGDPGYWGYDPITHTFIQGIYEGANPGDPWIALPEQCWESPFVFLHDSATSDNLYETSTSDVRGFTNRGFFTVPEEQYDKFFDNSKYGWLRGGVRGLFLYSFPATAWVDSPSSDFVFGLTSHAMNRNLPPTHRNSHYPKNFGGHVFWHKTPDGIVPHWYTRPWINHQVGLWHGQGTGYHFSTNYEFYQTPSMVITPPDGGVMRFDTNTVSTTCREYRYGEYEGSQDIYDEINEDYSMFWNECDRKAYDGSIYDEDEVTAFLRIWGRLADFQAVKDIIDFDSEYIDNIPYMVGVAGAAEGSLLAMIKVEGGKTFYIWRVIDEEEGEASIPLLPIAGGTTYYETEYDFFGNPSYIDFWWPIFNCGEVWNQWTQTGNIKTAYDTTTPAEYNVSFIYRVPGLGRIATKIVHQYIWWPNDVLDTLFDDGNPSPPDHGYSVPSGLSNPAPVLSQPFVDTEDVFDLEMPVYLMTYREKALQDEGQSATRWGGSFMKAGGNISCTSYENVADGSDDGVKWEISAALRDRDMC